MSMIKKPLNKLIVATSLTFVAAVAWLIPYDFLSCKPAVNQFITSCFIRNALLSVFRVVPLGFALAVLFLPPGRKD